MLVGLAEQGDAPKALARVDARGVPVRSLMVSAAVTFLAVLVNYLMPGRALELLMSLVVAALVINWAMISLAHLKFRAQMDRRGVRTGFRALWYPAGNYLCLGFVLFILGVMLLTPGIQVSVYAIPVWLLVMFACYRLKRPLQARQAVALAD
ncbi:Aromatic amino acid transport protein AroP [compost metagenome]